jgi:hypothetical protein
VNNTVPTNPNPWSTGISYAIGDLVTCNGHIYQCRMTHMSMPWSPGSTPTLWMDLDVPPSYEPEPMEAVTERRTLPLFKDGLPPYKP